MGCHLRLWGLVDVHLALVDPCCLSRPYVFLLFHPSARVVWMFYKWCRRASGRRRSRRAHQTEQQPSQIQAMAPSPVLHKTCAILIFGGWGLSEWKRRSLPARQQPTLSSRALGSGRQTLFRPPTHFGNRAEWSRRRHHYLCRLSRGGRSARRRWIGSFFPQINRCGLR